MYSTEENPHGCCDGYMCVGMLSTITYFFILINDYEMF